MKHIKYFLLCLFSIVSCDLLDRPVYDNVEHDNAYRTDSDIELAVNGVYGLLDNLFTTNFVNLSELPGDNAQTVGENTDRALIDKFSCSPVNSLLESAWSASYRCISNANEVIAAIPNVEFSDPDKKDQYLGEVYFIRALCYFNLVRWFGDLPLINAPISIEQSMKLTRTKAETIYDELIIPDLTNAMNLLPDAYSGEEIGRATSGAAASLLGKVYLTLHDYENAATVLEDVITSERYSLLPNYADIFDPNNANHAESIFEIQFEKGYTGGSGWSCAAHNSNLSDEFGVSTGGGTMPTSDIIDALDPTSARYAASIGRGKNNGPRYIKKHYMELSIQNHSDDNWPYLRYADVLLMYAEASNELTAAPSVMAVDCVNKIRRRAYGITDPTNTSHDLTDAETIDRDTFREVVWLERRLELAFEGHRWFDLVRTGQYVTVMNNYFATYNNGNYVVESYNNLFPVPQYEIDVNPNLQPNNPGYN